MSSGEQGGVHFLYLGTVGKGEEIPPTSVVCVKKIVVCVIALSFVSLILASLHSSAFVVFFDELILVRFLCVRNLALCGVWVCVDVCLFLRPG